METMEELVSLAEKADSFIQELEDLASEWTLKLKNIFWGDNILSPTANSVKTTNEGSTPQQVKKRIKRLSSLAEESNQEFSRDGDFVEALQNSKSEFSRTSNSSASSIEAPIIKKIDEKQNNTETFLHKNAKKNVEKSLQKRSSDKNLQKKSLDKDLKRTGSEKDLQKQNSQIDLHKKNLDKNLQNLEEDNLSSTTINSTFTVGDSSSVTSSSKKNVESSNNSISQGRPQRAAKIKSEKNYKEPSLRIKMRQENSRPVVKLEHEQRHSQMHESVKNKTIQKQNETITTEAVIDKVVNDNLSDSIMEVPVKRLTTITLDNSIDDENITETASASYNKNNDQEKITESKMDDSTVMTGRQLRIKIKREKGSFIDNSSSTIESHDKNVEKNKNFDNAVFKVPTAPALSSANTTTTSTKTTKLTESQNINKKNTSTRKKKVVAPKPIKVERFSDIDVVPSPVALRTRKGSLNRLQQQMASKPLQQEQSSNVENIIIRKDEDKVVKRETSIYEDAVGQLSATECTKEIQKEQVTTEHISEHLDNNEKIKDNFAEDTETNAAEIGQTTFVIDSNLNTTVTLGKTMTIESNEKLINPVNETFEVLPGLANITATTAQTNDEEHRSFVTAKDISEYKSEMTNIFTEDDDDDDDDKYYKLIANKLKSQPTKIANNTRVKNVPELNVSAVKSKPILPLKTFKTSDRPKELFNPLMQSPVKLRVEAFEHAAAANSIGNSNQPSSSFSSRLPKAKKENIAPTNNRTPTMSKLNIPGRFLTPTQTSNTLNSIPTGAVKKAPNSTSKIYQVNKLMASHSTLGSMTTSNLTKSGSNMINSLTGSISGSTSSLARTVSRENSAEEIRKNLQSSTEERKRQREQKHLQAALLREAKERERAERVAKLNKEREEKRLKRQMENEQKKRELEEISRKLKQGEIMAENEAARIRAAKVKAIAEKEREMLLKIKQQQQIQQSNYQQQSQVQHMLPPEPRQPKYTFEMLHEDDSTDEETKITYKRPQPPLWSRSHVRGSSILLQQHMSTAVIDSFFSVQPMTPDLKTIFPTIDDRYLKRNSSVLWSTPPRYSELPKY